MMESSLAILGEFYVVIGLTQSTRTIFCLGIWDDV